ncbi:MAG: RNA-protein complex protein Nop10 [Promethearchaeota archaeon]
MGKKIKICKACKIYTLRDTCPNCGQKTSTPHPPKYSPQDKYQEYRIQYFKEKFRF